MHTVIDKNPGLIVFQILELYSSMSLALTYYEPIKSVKYISK